MNKNDSPRNAMKRASEARKKRAIPKACFTCAICHEHFKSDWTEAEAQAECVENFGALDASGPTEVVCHDCYTGSTWMRQLLEAKRQGGQA